MNNKYSKKHASSILIIVLLVINCASTSKPIAKLTYVNRATGLPHLESTVQMVLEYPEWALEERVQGIIEVAALIRRDGTVNDAKIKQSFRK